MGAKVLHVWGEQGTSVTKALARLTSPAGPSERDGGHRPEVTGLAFLAGANRAQLAALTEDGVMAGLRETVTGVTCLASVRPSSPRLKAASIVLARSLAPREGQRRLRDELTDEGGIYSW